MAEYEKVTPAKFRGRLKDGHYNSLTGARRAVGRMSEWTEQQRNRARNEAEKYFEGNPTPKKVDKKVAKAGKKAAKKTTKKAAKKTSARGAKKTGPLARHHADKQAANKLRPAEELLNVEYAANKVGTINQALQSMRTAKELGADETEVAKGAKKAQQVLIQIVEELCGTVSRAHLSDEEQRAAENLGLAAAAGANGAAIDADAPPAPVVPPAVGAEA